MLLKLNVAAAKPHVPIDRAWSALAAFFRSRKQLSRDRHILLNLNDHDLRHLGLTRPQNNRPRRIY
jgi:uncharacterized protein YjiS (DUF1127 family)